MENRLLGYLYYFNVKHDYFECHEYGESLWLDSGRPVVLKGLIQAAVCLYHLENGNVKGAWRMWQRAKTYLAPSLPVFEGINLTQLTADIDEVFHRVPQTLYHQVIAPSRITKLDLPRVLIHITDPHMKAALEHWSPGEHDLDDESND